MGLQTGLKVLGQSGVVARGVNITGEDVYVVKAFHDRSFCRLDRAGFVLRSAANENSVISLGLPGRSSQPWNVKAGGPASLQGLRRGSLRSSLRCERSLVEAGGVEPLK